MKLNNLPKTSIIKDHFEEFKPNLLDPTNYKNAHNNIFNSQDSWSKTSIKPTSHLNRKLFYKERIVVLRSEQDKLNESIRQAQIKKQIQNSEIVKCSSHEVLENTVSRLINDSPKTTFKTNSPGDAIRAFLDQLKEQKANIEKVEKFLSRQPVITKMSSLEQPKLTLPTESVAPSNITQPLETNLFDSFSQTETQTSLFTSRLDISNNSVFIEFDDKLDFKLDYFNLNMELPVTYNMVDNTSQNDSNVELFTSKGVTHVEDVLLQDLSIGLENLIVGSDGLSLIIIMLYFMIKVLVYSIKIIRKCFTFLS